MNDMGIIYRQTMSRLSSGNDQTFSVFSYLLAETNKQVRIGFPFDQGDQFYAASSWEMLSM
jgi:hypothetical protein